jgi:hypothetical protein
MKTNVLAIAALLLAGAVAPAFAFDSAASAPVGRLGGSLSRGLVQNVDCDPNGDGKQANCMRDCEEEEIRSRETYHSRTDADRLAEKKACATKCGC